MGEAKPFENTTISAPVRAVSLVRNRDDGGAGAVPAGLATAALAYDALPIVTDLRPFWRPGLEHSAHGQPLQLPSYKTDIYATRGALLGGEIDGIFGSRYANSGAPKQHESTTYSTNI